MAGQQSGRLSGRLSEAPSGGDDEVPRSPRRFVLASASPARLGLLQTAGFDPEVRVSGIDEDVVGVGLPGEERVVALAEAKLAAVLASSGDGLGDDELGDAVVLACDSMFEFDGAFVGKPADVNVARRRIQAMRGRAGLLHTGHAVVDLGSGRRASGAAGTIVRFGEMTDGEIEAYLATGESLQVAGGFTLDGYAAPFIAGIEGDHGNVIGLSLPLLRALLAAIAVPITDLWV